MTATQRAATVRQGDSRVTNVELFFDLVYVFAVTQLSHTLIEHPSAEGALQAAILLALVWQIWVYTAWTMNYLNPDHGYVRVLLLGIMLASLVIASAVPEAFHSTGAVLAITWATVHVGQPLFVVIGIRDRAIRMIYARVLPWCTVSGTLVVVGGFTHEHHLREILWVSAVVLDLVGASIGFWVPGLDRSTTQDWTISGSHFAERCHLFVIIALGESIVITGGLLDLDDPPWQQLVAFVAAFLGAVALWWVYFDRGAEAGLERIDNSADPGRLARNAYHYVHPLIIGGIIVTAAADERVLEHPTGHAHLDLVWFVLGGTALYLAGHAAFKAIVWNVVPWTRIAAVVVLLALVPVGTHVNGIVLGTIVIVSVVLVAIGDRLMRRTDGQVSRD